MTTERDNIFKTHNRYSILTTERALNSDKNSDKNSDTNSDKNCVKRTGTKHVPQNRKNIINNTLKIFSTNGAGVIGGKVNSLKAQVKLTKANLVTLQETHARRKGRI